jgi:ribonuclease PH
VSVAILRSGKVIINPDLNELGSDSTSDPVESTHTIAYEVQSNQITRLLLCESTGKFTEDQLYKVLEESAEACLIIHKSFRRAVSDKIERDFVWKPQE